MAMTFASPKRSFLSLPFLLPSIYESAAWGSRRNQSTYRRTKARLRIKPDASFSPSAKQSKEHIIHNPPSSAPDAHHTPTKFLPPDDIRRTLRIDSSQNNDNPHDLPNMSKFPTWKPRYHLTPSDVEEIRRLRLSDPMTWSANKLAKRFDCAPKFIMIACEAAPQKKEMQKKILEAVQSRWGQKKRMAREDRQLRRQSWGRD